MLLLTLVIFSILSYNVVFSFTQVGINLKLRASQFKVAKSSNVLSPLGGCGEGKPVAAEGAGVTCCV